MSVLRGYDIDGVLSIGIRPEAPYVVISGRTFSEYDEFVKKLAQNAPVYIRGSGRVGDCEHAGKFKAQMINALGVTEFYEDNTAQLAIIKKECPACQVFFVCGINHVSLT